MFSDIKKYGLIPHRGFKSIIKCLQTQSIMAILRISGEVIQVPDSKPKTKRGRLAAKKETTAAAPASDQASPQS